MSCYIRLFHSLVMWSEPLLSVMTEENPKDMVLLSFQERTLLKLLCSKLMMAYSSLEGNSKNYDVVYCSSSFSERVP